MKIKIKICDGEKELDNFLNNEIDYCGWRAEHIILAITQDRTYYTVIYKDYNEED